MRKKIKQIMILLISLFAFLVFVFLALFVAYPNFNYTIEGYFKDLFDVFSIVLIYYFAIVTPLALGELFLYKVKRKPKISLLLPFLLYVSFVVLGYLVYVIANPSYSEGILEAFLFIVALIYAPIAITIYSVARLLLLRRLIKKEATSYTVIEVIDKYYRKIIKVLLILILIAGFLFVFDQLTNGRFLRLNVYSWISGKDPSTYEVLDKNKIYAKDAHQVYCRNCKNGIIPDADPESFVVLEKPGFSKDKDNVYHHSEKFENVIDAESFRFLKTEKGDLTDFAKDKKSIYRFSDSFDDLDLIGNADYETFEIIDKYEARDKNRDY